MKLLDLFSGIGGFSLGLERAGFETIAFCEIEEYPRKVLAKHWPDVPIAGDIRKLSYNRLTQELIYDGKTIYRGTIDAICGGFPCQDISVAGNQKGITAERSGLWSELHRLISEIRPRYAIVENVTALLSGESGYWFQRVLGDLAEIRYDAEWHCISASELGANHHRDRVWIICYPEHTGQLATEIGESYQTGNGSHQKGQEPASESQVYESGKSGSKNDISDTMREGLQGRKKPRIFREGRKGWNELIARCVCGFESLSEVEPTICGDTNGLPNYAHRLKGLGNAVVPQIPEALGLEIMEYEKKGGGGYKYLMGGGV